MQLGEQPHVDKHQDEDQDQAPVDFGNHFAAKAQLQRTAGPSQDVRILVFRKAR